MAEKDSSIYNKRFKKFCNSLNLKINKEIENSEFEYDPFIENEDILKGKLTFKNFVNPNIFLELVEGIKNNKVFHTQIEYFFDLLVYKTDEIVKFIKEIINNNSKYEALKSINWEKKFTAINNYEFELQLSNKKDEEKIASALKNLNLKLKKCGFKNILIKTNTKAKKEVKFDTEEKAKLNKEIFEKLASLDAKKDNENFSHKIHSRRNKDYQNVAISDIFELPDKSNVSVSGFVYDHSMMITKNNRFIYSFFITDFKNAIELKWFLDEEIKKEELDLLVSKKWFNFLGSVSVSNFSSNFIYLDSYKEIQNPFPDAIDTSKNKRVELHVTSKMNTMDGLLLPEEIIDWAEKFQMPAVCIMDVDGAQGYPKFFNRAKNSTVKPLYGTAFSMIYKNTKLIYGQIPSGTLKNTEYVSFDIETSSLSPKFGDLIEYGSATISSNLKIKNKNQMFIKSRKKIGDFTTDLTGITNEMLEKEGINPKEALLKIYEELNNKIAVAHNASFDFNYLKEKFREFGVPFPNVAVIDTLIISRIVFADNKKHKLSDVANRVGVQYNADEAHRGDYDANVLANVWISLLNRLVENYDISTFKQLLELANDKTLHGKSFTYEISTIAKNNLGLREQFEMISNALTTNFNNGPKTFWEDLPKYKNILIGSGTLKSSLINALLYSSHEELKTEIEKYDYIEVPAPQDFQHLIDYGQFTKGEIELALKELIHLGIKNNKIVVATADVKYGSINDKLPYEIIVYAKGIKNARHYLYDYEQARKNNLSIPNQQFLTTNEMLEAFSFLNDEKLIEDIVINNPRKIADMCENVEVIKKGLFTPKFDNSAVKLKELVYKNAHKKYGEVLPELIAKRIDDELTPIIKYGFDVIYWISYKLIQKSVDNGFIVGSRGSVGSSFIATLCGISEVNPLPPHYLCKKCKHFELANIEGITSGFDLPKKDCPNCNTRMFSDGQTIPFETFLGFKADKVPDIDLNFSGEFQGEIHNETRRLFGDNHTFRAGTISTVAFKTGYGYVKSYIEETGKKFPDAYINYLAKKIEDLKRTTSQHAGGIIIIPKEYNVLDFTPINYPANEQNSTWLTTHFDYRSIHDNVLKLDILGHDNPTVIKLLEKYTGINIMDVPMNDSKTISIFSNAKELGISPQDINGEPTGALGLPEFGTPFVRQMLTESKPKSFADLISLSGLSHGTDVWRNNAEDLVVKNKFKLKDIICCRDDILAFLLEKNVPSKFAFDTMEKVRKGKGITEDEEKELKKYKVPQWQIDSMKKIKYMFPKAHAAAYVLMAWWAAWFKVYYPLAFYASYFASHAKAVDVENMIDKIKGKKVKQRLESLNNIPKNQRTVKESDLISTLEITEELYARGYWIDNIDIEKSDAHEWVIDQKKQCLIPPFESIDGLGDAVAISIVNARKNKSFSSIEDFTRRTLVNKTTLQKMKDMNIFAKLDESDQMTLF